MNMQKTLLAAMSPIGFSMFPEDVPSMTQSFAKRASVSCHPDTSATFDIWLAGLLTVTFMQIGGDFISNSS
jgi:hypothetical protein